MGTRVLIAAAGTGGHVFPGIAVAREFARRDPDAQIVFVGTRRGLETRVIPNEGFPLELIEVAGLKRVGPAQLIRTLVGLPRSFRQAQTILHRHTPEVVLGVGGYTSGPVLLAAALQNRPTMIVEPNALPGFTNRVLSRWVRAAALTFSEAQRFFPGKAVITGNPVRPEFFSISARPMGDSPHILIFGGSQGSHALNLAMLDLLPFLLKQHIHVTATLQTGERDLEMVRAASVRFGLQQRWETRAFIDSIAQEFARAAFVISRAGATTVAEITAAGRPAILIPLPTAADDHQRKNAEALEREGAAVCILQSEMTSGRLESEIQQMLNQPGKLEAMSVASRGMARADAASQIVDLAYQLIRGEPIAVERRESVRGNQDQPGRSQCSMAGEYACNRAS